MQQTSQLRFVPHPLNFFFFNAPAPTEIYTLSLHDALPILVGNAATTQLGFDCLTKGGKLVIVGLSKPRDRKSTRLNSSHQIISYAVFCLKKKKNGRKTTTAGVHSRDIRRADRECHGRTARR